MIRHSEPGFRRVSFDRNIWQPVEAAERYWHIDVIRALALFGVLIVNELSMYRVPLLEHILSRPVDNGSLDSWVEHVVRLALDFKALTIFSFLFGVGIAIQIERAEHRKVDVMPFLLRRFTWLCVFGLAHMLLIWDGDILTLYGLCGLIVLPASRLRWWATLILGASLLAVQNFAWLPLSLPSGMAALNQIQQARELYTSNKFLHILRFRVEEIRLVILPLVLGILPRTLGLMLWGMAGWRSNVLRQPRQHWSKLVFFFISTVVAVTLEGARSPMIVAAAYVSGLLCLLPIVGFSRARGLAAMGQMAITNYLLQSIVLGLIFYGYGLRLFGRLSSAQMACIGVALYAVQVATSVLWLRWFRFGPVEWAWRSLTYWKRQAMRAA